MAMTTVRWLGKIETDLSVPLEGLDRKDIKVLCLDSIDDPWAEQIADIVSEDAFAIEYGMFNPACVTVRDVAAHAMNRYRYYTARQQSKDPRVHRLLDDLLLFGVPMEGVNPEVIKWTDTDGTVVQEYLGKFNFHSALVRDLFDKRRALMPYEVIQTNRYSK